jgi:hypothetical protein
MAQIIPIRCNGACETPSEVCCNQDCNQGRDCPHSGHHVPMPDVTARVVQHIGTGEYVALAFASAILAFLVLAHLIS